MRRTGLVLGLLVLAGCGVQTAGRVGAGYAAHVTCSLAFNSGLDAERVFRDYVVHDLAPFGALVGFELDPEERSVTGRALGGVVRMRAVHAPGRGCTLLAESAQAPAPLPRGLRPGSRPAPDADRPWPRGAAPAAALPDPATAHALEAALDRAFAEPYADDGGPLRQTTAVLVVHEGRLVAERYGPGVTAATPLPSWSMAKSVLATLLGLAAAEGRVDLGAPAPVEAWSEPGDPRRAITPGHLLRMTSGLAFDEEEGAMADLPVMLFTRADTAAYAAAKPLDHEPGSHWAYSSGSSNIAAGVLADTFGRDPARFVAWVQERLLAPVGLSSAILELDASGTFIGSSFAFLTARDWARLGQLHLQDGVWEGRRVLPAGWVESVTTPAPPAPRGIYGAGWWLNAGDPANPTKRMWPSLPRDTYAMRGHSGQYVVVVPSARLVVVRTGLSHSGESLLHGIEPLTRDTLHALTP